MRIKIKTDEIILYAPINEGDTLESLVSKVDSYFVGKKMSPPQFYFFKEQAISRELSNDLRRTLYSLGLKNGSVLSAARYSAEEKITSLSVLIGCLSSMAQSYLHSYMDTDSLTNLSYASKAYRKILEDLLKSRITMGFKRSIPEGKHILNNRTIYRHLQALNQVSCYRIKYTTDDPAIFNSQLSSGEMKKKEIFLIKAVIVGNFQLAKWICLQERRDFPEFLQQFSVRNIIGFRSGVLKPVWNPKFYDLNGGIESNPNIPIIAVASGNLEFIERVANKIDFSMAIYGMRLSLRQTKFFPLPYRLFDLYKKKHQSHSDKLAEWFYQRFPLLDREFMFSSLGMPTVLLQLIEDYLHYSVMEEHQIYPEKLDEFKLLFGESDDKEKLRSSCHCDEYASTYCSERVAVKVARSFDTDLRIILSEAVAMQEMSETSDFVLGFKGVIFEPDLVLVSERYAGNLRQFLEKSQGPVDIRQKFLWAEQISEALKKMHEKDIIHYNFYIHNIFLDFNKKIKIGPFSLFDFVPSGTHVGGCTEPFVPEHEKCNDRDEIKKFQWHTESSNVYLLGFILIQIFSGTIANLNSKKEQLLKKFPSECPEGILKLITTCLDDDEKQRPSAGNVWAAFFKKNSQTDSREIVTPACLTNG